MCLVGGETSSYWEEWRQLCLDLTLQQVRRLALFLSRLLAEVRTLLVLIRSSCHVGGTRRRKLGLHQKL